MRKTVDITFLFGAVLLVDAIAIVALVWTEHFTKYEGIVLWEEDSPVVPLFWGSVIVLLAGVLSLVEFPVWGAPAISVNAGGAIAPLAVSGLIVWRRRPRAVPVLAGTAATAFVAVVAATVWGRPYFVPFPVGVLPAVSAAAVAVAFGRERLMPALDVAYVGASLGTLVGVDLIPLTTLPPPSEASGAIVLGAGGILDLVFLSGVIAVAIAWCVQVARGLVRSARAGPRPEPADVLDEPRPILWRRRPERGGPGSRLDERPK